MSDLPGSRPKPSPGTLSVDAELALVPVHPNDAGEIFAVVEAHRDDLREWLTWVDDTRNVSDLRRYALTAQTRREERIGFDYSLRLNGVVAGGIGLHNFDWAGRNAHIGYWLARDARGRGAITRAARAITTFAFTRLGLHRLEIRCVVENRRSRAVAERLGYQLEGILHEAWAQHGEFRNLALYAMLAGQWEASA
jgi:ribosomal-protein-serine acetyltransferase